MTLSSDDSSCATFQSRRRHDGQSKNMKLGEGEGSIEAKSLVDGKCMIIPVYNGRELDINHQLICSALSGISMKHYDGNCVPPPEPEQEENMYEVCAEDYLFDEEVYGEEDYLQFNKPDEIKSMNSMIKLCWEKKASVIHPGKVSGEGQWDVNEKPLCVQNQINFRNSFWDIHRPELCKLTWPHVYVGEAIVTEHLHRHLLKHGPICSQFHEEEDMITMLDEELNTYDTLKVLQSPKEIPPDEDWMRWLNRGNKRKKYKPIPLRCQLLQMFTKDKDFNDESDIDPNMLVHGSKEEFCITIGRPIKKPTLREVEEPEAGYYWLPYEGEYEGGAGYRLGSPWEYSSSISSNDIEEDNEEDECSSDTELEVISPQTPPPDQGWVEPDYCAMI